MKWVFAPASAACLLAAGLTVASVTGGESTASAGAHVDPAHTAQAMSHGAHDPRVEAALAQWHALGRPAGRAMPAPAQDAPADGTVTLRTQGSNLDFEPRQISAKAGTRLRVVYVNEGTLPHNFVLLHDEDDLDALGQASYQAQDTGFVPLARHADKLIAYTPLASPGDTVEVTFEVPPPGEYLFACTVPGHYNVMLGTLRSLP